MRILEKTSSFKKGGRPLVLALGNFDGIHRGHRRLLDYVVTQSKKMRGKAAVFTFQEHPQHILHPEHAPENLQSREQKMQFLKSIGIKLCFFQKFDREFSKLSAERFVEKILVKQLGVREICLGYNARFGRGRQGDADLLRKLGARFGFEVFQAEPVVWRGSPVSSTAVREALRHGKIKMASELLGRHWSLEGKVIRGDGRGWQLGFPTANLDAGSFVRPAKGVYAVRVRVGKEKKLCNAVVNVGVRPSFISATEVCIEAHLLDFKSNLYGKKIEVFFIKQLRLEKKFSSAELLKKQIRKDIQRAVAILKKEASL
jgi:riboflavin kinase/FMN adenylyltransferase